MGYGFLINHKWGDGKIKFELPFIFDDDMYQLTEGIEDYSIIYQSEELGGIDGCLDFIHLYVPYALEQVEMPYNYDTSWEIEAERESEVEYLLSAFPKLKKVSNSDGIALRLNNYTISSNAQIYADVNRLSSGELYSSIGAVNLYNFLLNQPLNMSDDNLNSDNSGQITFKALLTQEIFLDNGVIKFNESTRFKFVTIYLSKRNEVYKAEVSITRDSSTMRDNKWKAYNGLEPEDISTDPFDGGGTSGDGGGGGDFDDKSDPIDIPSLPKQSIVDSGLVTIYNPNISQLNDLATYLWANFGSLESLQKLFANPLDVILSLSIVPVDIPTRGNKVIKVGNISTGVEMTVANSQWVSVDCGNINVNEYWGAYLDYSPYTKCDIYLPFIGTHALSVDDIMGKSINVTYHIDIVSGACVAYIKCGKSVLYSFIGQCSVTIPVTAGDYTNIVSGILGIAGSVGSLVATGGGSLPALAAMGEVASSVPNMIKPEVEKSGSCSGTGGYMGIRYPYLILTRPRQCLPNRQNTFTGYPSFTTKKLSSLKGYTEIEKIHLKGIHGTSSEINEIELLLKEGVIL